MSERKSTPINAPKITRPGESSEFTGSRNITEFLPAIFRTDSNKKFLVRASYIEIYQEEIRDLLAKQHDKKLDLRENPGQGVFVADLSIPTVKSIPEIEHLMAHGNKLRMVGQTAMNDTSSRSHSIFTIYIETAETVSLIIVSLPMFLLLLD